MRFAETMAKGSVRASNTTTAIMSDIEEIQLSRHKQEAVNGGCQ